MSSPTLLEPGVVLDNRYTLTQCLGGGGMGQVWEAVHASLGHHVAIKVLHGSIMSSAEPRARFDREARLMAQLGDSTRHITRVIEHGVLPDGVPFLVMELMRGEDLSIRLKKERVLPLTKVADVVNQLCKALTVAHAHGVVHRDIKPANVFLCPEDDHLLVKLLDFGVAKAEGSEQTVSGQVIGTPNYMSPEQLTGEYVVDHRADLFAVGAIAYRAATGKTAFGKGSMSEMAMRIVTMMPPAPSVVNPSLPLAFDGFALKALAKNPNDRFQSAKELADALVRLVADLGKAADTAGAPLGAGDSGQHPQMSMGTLAGAVPASIPSRPRRSPTWLIAGVVAAAVLGGFWMLRTQRAPEAAAPVPPVVAPIATPSAIAALPAPSASVAQVDPTPPASATASADPAAPPSAAAAFARGGRVGGPRVAPAKADKPDDKPTPPAVTDTWHKKDEM